MKVAAEDENKLLVILLDGFRWDYLEKLFRPNELPGFSKIVQKGIRAKSLQPDFPSLSYPNYYSLMTGLHAENHGIIHNYMYDPTTKLNFLIGENPDQFNPIWWDDGEPLWVTAEKQGKASYWWYWCGCEVEIRRTRPKFCQPYGPAPSIQNFSDALDLAVEVIKNGSADLVGVYFGEVDHWGHAVGPTGENVSSVIRQVDAQLSRMLNILESEKFPSDGKKLSERVNVMIFSDHGMTALVDRRSGVVRFDLSLVDSGDVVIGSTFGPILQVYTGDDRMDALYERLKSLNPNVTVYKKPDIPQRFFYKRHRRTPPLVLVADLGYVIGYKPNTTNIDLGFHGYDNEYMDMHGILFASGPDFKAGFRTDTLRAIDLYQVMCFVLDIRPSPHNGTWNSVSSIFTRSSAIRMTASFSPSELMIFIIAAIAATSEKNI